VTVSRGIRMTEQQFARAWDVFLDVTKHKPIKSSIQLNEVFTVLLELGLTTWPRLPGEMRRGLFRRRKYSQREKFQATVQERVARLSEKYKLDDRLALAVPSTIKSDLMMEKQRTGVSMSRQVRQKLMEAA
jgi:hypothetical protein